MGICLHYCSAQKPQPWIQIPVCKALYRHRTKRWPLLYSPRQETTDGVSQGRTREREVVLDSGTDQGRMVRTVSHS